MPLNLQSEPEMPEINFDLSGYEMSAPQSFDPMPPGDYITIVTNSELKDTKAGDGQYIELTMQIVDGPFSGRRHWERLNIINKSDKTQEIARSHLNALLKACGVPNAKNTEETHDIPFTMVLYLDRKEPTRNRIMGYSPAGAAQAPKPAAPKIGVPEKRAWER
jgi:hypothetical protein